MRLLSNIVSRIWDKLLITFGVLCVLLPTSPLNVPLTYRDSGVFLYIGWRILNGELPYQDIWDHKPPLIFYINALGLAISNNSRWGVWLIELVALFFAAFIGFRLIKKVLGPLPAIFSSFHGLLTLVFVIEGGNLTEEYALPLQFACLWLVHDFEKSRFPHWRLLLIGLLSGIAFFTKQTTIGIGIAIVLYLAARRLSSGQAKQLLRELLLIIAGGLTVFIVIATFFCIQGALQRFWDAAFRYNFAYSSSIRGITSRFKPIVTGVAPLTKAGLFQFSLIGYVIGLVWAFCRKELTSNWSSLLSIGLIDLPIELILVSASGRTYPHYFISILPILTLFDGLTFWALLSQVSHLGISNAGKGIFTIGVIGGFLWSSFISCADQVRAYRKQLRNTTMVTYIRTSTSPDDTVLLWGGEATTNYFAQRRSPSRFVYQSPLYQFNYVNEKIIEEFISDIVRNRPRLIIDTKNPSTPMYDFPIQTEAIQAGIEYLQSHYRMKENVGHWTVYEYVGDRKVP